MTKDSTKEKGLSLIELLIAISIISLFLVIQFPLYLRAKKNANSVINVNNQRQIIFAVLTFAVENDGYCPPSIATSGTVEKGWNWQEPTMLISAVKKAPELRRSVSGYLYSYINDAGIFFCPNAPKKYKYLRDGWEAGDQWDNPDTVETRDPLFGTYCFYWNYIGYLGEGKPPFCGRRKLATQKGQGGLLVSDYFGFGHWRNKNIYASHKAYGSCEPFISKFAVTPGTRVSSDFWSVWAGENDINPENLGLILHGGYVDGHVEKYSVSETIPMKVSLSPDGSIPYPEGFGPGIFFLPEKALY